MRSAPSTSTARVALGVALGLGGCDLDAGDDMTTEGLALVAGPEREPPTSGELGYGETSPRLVVAEGRHGHLWFEAAPDDAVEVRVSSTDGDAEAWLLDDDGVVLAANDDAGPRSRSARVRLVIPSHPRSRHHIVFRDRHGRAARLRVQLHGDERCGAADGAGGARDADGVPDGCLVHAEP